MCPDRMLTRLEKSLLPASSEETLPARKDGRYYAKKAYKENTYRAYRSDIRDFVAWTGLDNPLPVSPEIVELYITDLANRQNNGSPVYSPSTIAHRVAALSFVHRKMGYQDPTDNTNVRDVLKGIQNERIQISSWRPNRSDSFTKDAILKMLDGMSDSKRDVRDRAMLLTGLFGAFRASELCAIKIKDILWLPEGAAIYLGATKNDPLNQSEKWVGIPYGKGICPASALKKWINCLEKEHIEEGYVFRGINKYDRIAKTQKKPISHTTVNKILQRWVTSAGLDSRKKYSWHSWRASFVTLNRNQNISDVRITRQTKQDVGTLKHYDRPENVFTGNAVIDLVEVFK